MVTFPTPLRQPVSRVASQALYTVDFVFVSPILRNGILVAFVIGTIRELEPLAPSVLLKEIENNERDKNKKSMVRPPR
jgi:hypothetical protein